MAHYRPEMSYAAWLSTELQEDPLYLLLVPYVVFQIPFRKYVKKTDVYNKNKSTFKHIMCFYNLTMSIFSAICSVLILSTLARFLLNSSEGNTNAIYSANHFSESTGLYSKLMYLFYLSKYIEFLDTYFLILCDREVSWLQYYHHIGAVIDCGCLYFGKNDGAWIFVGLNGAIHAVMYYYYACAIMKWEFKLMPKAWITSLQLCQFFTGFVVYYPYCNNVEFWGDIRKRNTWLFNYYYVGILVLTVCQTNRKTHYINYLAPIYLAVCLLFFANFYVRTYVLKKQNKKSDDSINIKSEKKSEKTRPTSSNEISAVLTGVKAALKGKSD